MDQALKDRTSSSVLLQLKLQCLSKASINARTGEGWKGVVSDNTYAGTRWALRNFNK